MKKVIIILSILLLTGCGVQDKTSMIINEDKSINIEVLKAIDNELIDNAINQNDETDKTYTDEERWKYLDDSIVEQMKEYPNINYEKYENEEYKGYKFIVKINNIDDVTSDDASYDISDLINDTTKLFKKEDNKYISKIEYTGVGVIEGVDYDLSFTITLPNEPLSHNADKVSEDKKTLTWDLLNSNDGEINFEFSFDKEENKNEKKDNKILIIGITVGIVAIISLVIILKYRKKEEF